MGSPRLSVKRGLLFALSGASLLAAAFYIFPTAVAQGAYYLPTTVYLTSGTSWTVPSGWIGSSNSIEVIGGGGGASTYGGGGGAYSAVSNVSLTPGSSVTYAVGAAGGVNVTGGDTYFCNSTSNCASIAGTAVVVGAKGGGAGSAASGYGGAASAGVGSVKYSGGNGGVHASDAGAGGGGAGGPHGNGNNGTNGSGTTGGVGGSGDAGYGGSGGLNGNPGGTGGTGTEWDSTHGSGGGGGGANHDKSAGPGGLYGGGGGAKGSDNYGSHAAGQSGIIAITYIGSTLVSVSISASKNGPLYTGDSVTYTISRNGPATYQAVSVDAVLGGTAVLDTDYTITGVSNGVVTIPANSLSTTVTATVLSSITSNKTFSFTLPNSPNYNQYKCGSGPYYSCTATSSVSYAFDMSPGVSTLSLNAYFYNDTQVNVAWSAQYANSCTVTGPNSFSATGLSGTRTTTPGVTPAQYVLACSTLGGMKYATSTTLSSAGLTSLTNGLIDYWSFNSNEITASSTVKDVSPNACSPGTLTNSPTPTAGHWGDPNNARSFNGSNTYISAPPVGITTGAITVSAWVYSTNFVQSGMIVEKEPANTQWELFFENTAGDEGSVGLKWRGGSSTGIVTPFPSNNAWHHIVATQSGTTAKIYIDGALVKTGTVAALGNATDYSANVINIGRYNDRYYFNGSIDEVMVYNRALSAAEVQGLYGLSASEAAALHSSGVAPPPALPSVETVSGYTPAPFSTYALPVAYDPLSGSSGNKTDNSVVVSPPLQPYPLLSAVSSTWYAGTPSPVTCGATSQGSSGLGSCLYFGDKKGTTVSTVKASPQLVATPGGSTLTSGLVGFWNLDSASVSGTALQDVSGNGNSGTLLNAPAATTDHWGASGNARAFSGSQYALVAPTSPATLSGTFTVSAWTKLTSTSGTLTFLGSRGPSNFGFDVKFYNGKIHADIGNGSSWINSTADATYSYATNTWYHIVYVVTTSGYTIYLNGTQIGSGTLSGTPLLFDGTHRLYIGQSGLSSAPEYFNGTIDEVMVWNRALSTGEVAELYGLSQAGAGSFQPLSPVQTGLDLVSTNPTNACGIPITHWSYVRTGTSTLIVPKYTPLQISYLCQPSQEYLWKTTRDYGCVLFWCTNASTLQQRIFRLADRLKVGGVAQSVLHTTQTQTVSATTDLTLECGGYVPEEGTQLGLRPTFPTGTDGFPSNKPIDDFNDYTSQGTFAVQLDALPHNIGLPPFYGLDRTPACWNECYWPWTYAFYNAASSTYYQPAATINVQVCSGSDEVVSGGVCTPCPSNQYRSGNSCVTTPPPTATIDAGAGFKSNGKDGKTISVAAGTQVTVVAHYSVVSNGGTLVVASGGTETTVGGYHIHTFTSSGTFSVTQGGDVDYLVVGGGGGGSCCNAGGGGGGGVITGSSYAVTSGASIPVTVGAGGTNSPLTNGGNSSFGTLTAIGGGAGGYNAGANGGSGGGGGGQVGNYAGGTATQASPGYGSNGGASTAGAGGGGGGGGGATQAGTNGTSAGGKGGNGYTSSISGTSVTYGGGGGGGGRNNCASGGAGGSGGGGTGGTCLTTVLAGAGTPNTGGGGGGGAGQSGVGNQAGAAGGSGVVIVRYTNGILATAINDDGTGTSVDCGKVQGFNGVSTTTYTTNSGCENNPDESKTYTFIANTPGTYTFSAQVKTGSYPNYNGYATVQVVVCPVGQASDGAGGCTNNDLCTNDALFPDDQTTIPPGAHANGDTTCSCDTSGYVYNGTMCTTPPLPTLDESSFTATRVRAGGQSTLSWSIAGMANGITCDISPANGLESPMPAWPGGSPWTGSVQTTAITQATRYTLTCSTAAPASASESVIVNIIPSYKEI